MAIQTFPASVDLKPCIQGEDYAEYLEFVDEDDALIDFTGSTFVAKAARSGSTATVVTFTVTNPSTGVLKIATTAAVTAAVDPKNYQYDLFQIDGSNVKTAVCSGNWPVKPGITY